MADHIAWLTAVAEYQFILKEFIWRKVITGAVDLQFAVFAVCAQAVSRNVLDA